MHDYEKLGAFYLGRAFDPVKGEARDEPILYDAKDLTTHAVCVGMTGSGKTGLGVSLLEEAAIDGIPIIAIDPKGDLGNVLLTFPELKPADFEPWVDPDEAARKGRTRAEQARATAELWRKGLAEWGQDGTRIGRFRDAVDMAIYTPGSHAGIPLDVLRSFAAPPPGVSSDEDALRERVRSAATGLLSLLHIDADPLRSREHILLSNLIDHAWREGRDLDLPSIIHGIQSPPFDQVGVFDLDTFYPSKDRLELAMTLNNLLASPGFATWTEGDPLDVHRLLHTEDGKPRLSIISIAHLSDSERMFIVTMLLNEVLAWVRTQPGTRSLRALLYMDEIFGYFPPTANPPSKTPMLTLLKQARAYGLGVVLATQNPVDLDYKGLANTGTWFLGRLQTERDKARVIDGLEGAAAASGAGFDRGHFEQLLSGLGSRVFLMNNVHEDQPVLFQTRWALSYLAGPLTRQQIGTLMEPRKVAQAAAAVSEARATGGAPAPIAATAAKAAKAAASAAATRPEIPTNVDERFLAETAGADGRLLYRPALLGTATLHWADARTNIDEWGEATLLAGLGDRTSGSPWEDADDLEAERPELLTDPEGEAAFARLPKAATSSKSYTSWKKMLSSHLYKTRPLTLWRCKPLKVTGEPGETEGDFQVRVRELVRERRDLAVEKMRTRYAPKLQRLKDRIQRAEDKIDKERSQYKQKKAESAVSWGSTLVSALFGRKLASVGNVGRAASAIKRTGKLGKEKADVAQATEALESLNAQLAELETAFEQDIEEVQAANELADFPIDAKVIRPRKSDLSIERLQLVWTPWRIDENGVAQPTFDH